MQNKFPNCLSADIAAAAWARAKAIPELLEDSKDMIILRGLENILSSFFSGLGEPFNDEHHLTI